MWVTVPVEAASLDDVESPRLVVDACPACQRRARLVERAVTRPAAGGWRVWQTREVAARVIQCEKCRACFELPESGLPPWEEKPEQRDKNLELARQRARFRNASAEAARWQKRSDLAIRAGDVSLAEEARRMAARYEGEALAARAEIERLGGELPGAARPDPREAALEAELAAMREKAAAKKAAAADAPADAAPAGDDDELAALKKRMARKEPDAPPPDPTPPPAAPPAGDDDELAALKRKLKPRG
jgi:Na+-translocating ferredoxin:NAD+ oxidoreductase RnfC subunit